MSCLVLSCLVEVVHLISLQYFFSSVQVGLPATRPGKVTMMMSGRASTEKIAVLPGHNTSLQQNVERNPDPALDIAHEHQHDHLHHSGAAARQADAGVSYTVGTSDASQRVAPGASSLDNHHQHHEHYQPAGTEKNTYAIAAADKQHQLSSESILEHGERDVKHHKVSRFYRRYKPFFHAFVWLLFTGYVAYQSSVFRRTMLTFSIAGGLLVLLYTETISAG